MGALQFLVGVGNVLVAGAGIACLYLDKRNWLNWLVMLFNLACGLFLLVASYGNVCKTAVAMVS